MVNWFQVFIQKFGFGFEFKIFMSIGLVGNAKCTLKQEMLNSGVGILNLDYMGSREIKLLLVHVLYVKEVDLDNNHRITWEEFLWNNFYKVERVELMLSISSYKSGNTIKLIVVKFN